MSFQKAAKEAKAKAKEAKAAAKAKARQNRKKIPHEDPKKHVKQ